jgi:hypothetical protein
VCEVLELGYPCCESDANCTDPENACRYSLCNLDTNTCNVTAALDVVCPPSAPADRCRQDYCNASAGGVCEVRPLSEAECPGACCFAANNSCYDGGDDEWCTEAGGVFAGINTTCNATECPTAEPTAEPSPAPTPVTGDVCPNSTLCVEQFGGFCAEYTEQFACPDGYSLEDGLCDRGGSAPVDATCTCCAECSTLTCPFDAALNCTSYGPCIFAERRR